MALLIMLLKFVRDRTRGGNPSPMEALSANEYIKANSHGADNSKHSNIVTSDSIVWFFPVLQAKDRTSFLPDLTTVLLGIIQVHRSNTPSISTIIIAYAIDKSLELKRKKLIMIPVAI